MYGNHVEDFVRQRFTAQKHLVTILTYQGVPRDVLRFMDPANTEEYKINWGFRVARSSDLEKEYVEFERDGSPEIVRYEYSPGNFLNFYVSYLAPSDKTKAKITKSRIEAELTALLHRQGAMGDQEKYNKDNRDKIRVLPGVHMIFASKLKLDGAAKNLITDTNSLLEFPIRHFSLDELQFDPTIHAMAPKRMAVASYDEVRGLIERQKGLKLGRYRLVPDFQEQYDSKKTYSEKSDYANETDEEILDKLQTINTTDPMVKWRGYKLNDVIMIERRIGNSRFGYRRVVHADRVVKPPKVKEHSTNK